MHWHFKGRKLLCEIYILHEILVGRWVVVRLKSDSFINFRKGDYLWCYALTESVKNVKNHQFTQIAHQLYISSHSQNLELILDFRFGDLKLLHPHPQNRTFSWRSLTSNAPQPPLKLNQLMENIAVFSCMSEDYRSATHCPFTEKLFTKRIFLDCILLTMFTELGLHDYDCTSLLAFIALSAAQSSATDTQHSAILVIDTSNKASYYQVHWLVRTPYLSIKASNGYLRKVSYIQNACTWMYRQGDQVRFLYFVRKLFIGDNSRRDPLL